MANSPFPIPASPPPECRLVGTLSDGTKVKQRVLRMRACNEKDEKGKLCAGHLKRWYSASEEVRRLMSPSAEVYRCERCRTIYVPNPEEKPRSATLCW